jgi:hypothetical protein
VNPHITYQQVIARLQENNLPYGELALQNGVRIVISQRSGRIFGPFLTEESESLFWLNPAFGDAGAFKAFLESGFWNIGGERMWISPEIQYNVTRRGDFDASYLTPPELDPGTYRLDQPAAGVWRLSQDMTLKTYNIASGDKRLHLENRICEIEDPLRKLKNYAALTAGVTFAGYEMSVTLSEGQLDDIQSETWILIQHNAGGDLIIPVLPGVEWRDYYEPVDETVHQVTPNYVRLKLTGTRRYKTGYKAAHVLGRLGYANRLDDGRMVLFVRNFFNNPSAPYVDEPDGAPGESGDSIHVYNDSGEMGGFGELEVHGQAIGGATGRSSSTDQFGLWLYVGQPEQISRIAQNLLGVAL